MKTLRDLLTFLPRTSVSGSLDTPVANLAYDSRQVGPQTAFVALRGVKGDGHRFIDGAIAAGASVIVAETAPPVEGTTTWIHVPDTRAALSALARAWFDDPARDLMVAGVTGTNGKTTTAYILQHLLNAAHQRCGLIGTVAFDNGAEQRPATHTTPESLELQGLLDEIRGNGCRAVAMEVSSHALDQRRVHGMKFDAAIFTNLTQDHLDYHRTMDVYMEAKAKLFAMASEFPRSALIINADDPEGAKLLRKHAGHPRLFSYGYSLGATHRAVDPKWDFDGTQFKLEAGGRQFLVRTPLIGKFNLYNSLAALTAAHALKLNLRETIDNLAKTPQIPGRLEQVHINAPYKVFVDYAHTPDALENVLKTIRELKPGRIVTVFGCGGDRDKTKRPLMGEVCQRLSDISLITSDNPRTEDPLAIIEDIKRGFGNSTRYLSIPNRRGAIRTALAEAKRNDIILIAGKGHEPYQEINGVRHDFDDRSEVKQNIWDITDTRHKEREERQRLREEQDQFYQAEYQD